MKKKKESRILREMREAAEDLKPVGISNESADSFLQSIDHPPKPNKALIAAAKKQNIPKEKSRNLGKELLQAVHQMKAGKAGRIHKVKKQ